MSVRFPLVGTRLLIRPFSTNDIPAVHQVYADERVMRFVGYGKANLTVGDTAKMINGYIAHCEKHGFGFWAVIERSTGLFIGDAGFEKASDEEVDFGYTLSEASWGKGYATEAGLLCLDLASKLIMRTNVVAYADPANGASARVLEKLGFQAEGTREAYGRPHLFYRLH